MVTAIGFLQPRLSWATTYPYICVGAAFTRLDSGAGDALPASGGRTPTEGRRLGAISYKHSGIPVGIASLQQVDDVNGSLGVDADDNDEHLDVDKTSRMINKIKAMLGAMGDAEVSVSPYDTAWVALVPDVSCNGGPQFPSSLGWIEENQLPDGSWGDRDFFNAYDRLLNTLACVIALKTWSACLDKCQRGVVFLRENMHRLEAEDAEQMPSGFEVVFPTLMKIAQSLDLRIHYDDPALRDIYTRGSLKLERIPKDIMHRVPTTLLFSLEGLPGLDWEKLLRLQCTDGSFLYSPASTAFAFMQTGNAKCLSYLEKTVQRFNGGAPHAYPMELFERLWAIDRLIRLGISRHFEEEIRHCLDYVHKCWTEVGIGWTRASMLPDIDDTCMGFRLLRLHGYDVSADVFRHFQKDDEFFCFAGQLNHAITHVFNLNRASQVSFAGEKILDEVKMFSLRFLREKQARNEVSDKWVITKDLPGEVEYGLDFPWYASLPRVETRFYLDQYGGNSDVWIGKTLNRMPCVSNDDYLELARSEFRRCQALHQLEWLRLQRWYEKFGLKWSGISRTSLLRCYFLAAASIFEPERAVERLGWAQTAILAEAVGVQLCCDSDEEERSILKEMKQALCIKNSNAGVATTVSFPRAVKGRKCRRLMGALLHTLDSLSMEVAASLLPDSVQPSVGRRRIRKHLLQAWGDWILAWRGQDGEASNVSNAWWPGGLKNDGIEQLLVRSLELCAGRTALEESLQAQRDAPLANLLTSLSKKLRHLHYRKLSFSEDGCADGATADSQEIELEMQELLECVLRNPNGDSHDTLQTFLTVAKSFYYVAKCQPAVLQHHIAKVLFEEAV